MDFFDAMNDIKKRFGVSENGLRAALDNEIESEQKDINGLKYARAVEIAHARIVSWLETGTEYAVTLNWADLAKFAGSHRLACVWAVFTSYAIAAKKEEGK